MTLWTIGITQFLCSRLRPPTLLRLSIHVASFPFSSIRSCFVCAPSSILQLSPSFVALVKSCWHRFFPSLSPLAVPICIILCVCLFCVRTYEHWQYTPFVKAPVTVVSSIGKPDPGPDPEPPPNKQRQYLCPSYNSQYFISTAKGPGRLLSYRVTGLTPFCPRSRGPDGRIGEAN